MRVFDFEGVIEGLNELIDELEGKNIPKNTIRDSQEEEDEEVILSEEKIKQEKKEEQEPAGLVLINNLSQVLGLLLKNNYVQGMIIYFIADGRGRKAYEKHRSSYIGDTGQKTAEHGTSTQSLRRIVELECLIWK